MYRIGKLVLIFGITSFVFLSCSTKKNTGLSRAYHNLTAKYNVYFNGKEAYKEGLLAIEDAHKEDYSKLLPVFIYSDKTAVATASGNMDRAIEKATKLILTHSITVKPKMPNGQLSAKQKEFYNKKEYCKWIDDGYFLLGRAYFYKQDFYTASKNFEYLNTEYKNTPIRFESTLWLARSKTEMGNYEDARMLLDMIIEDALGFPEKLKDEYYAIYADILIREKKYDDAIDNLKKAISYTKRKKITRRFTYILAQLYQEVGNDSKASELYASVLKMNPPYDMAFNAKISLATSFSSDETERAMLIKTLNKLLRDEKNKEFQDQIYFALANIYLKGGEKGKAVENFEKSIETSVSNNHQKAVSFLALGDIYFGEKKYIKSQPFYDSCMTLLETDYKDYNEIKQKSNNLNDLAKNYHIVEFEDSVQKIANMSEKDRNNLIDDLIEKYRKEQEDAKFAATQDQLNTQLYVQDFGLKNEKVSNGKFYFYNPSSINFGKSEFKKKWGARTLEDNWRRKNKTAESEIIEEEEELEEDSVAPTKKNTNMASRDYYTENIPLTQTQKAASDKRIEEAQFNMGIIYMSKFEFDEEAIKSFEEYVKRFPDGTYTAMSYYYLFKLYEKKGDMANALKCKKMVIDKYPDSVFAKALTNPNYIKEHKQLEAKIDKLYKATYSAYMDSDYGTVIANYNEASQKYPDSYLIPQFDFLKSMSEGKMTSMLKLKDEMKNIKKKYPKDSVSVLAQKVLTYLETQNVDSLLTAKPQMSEIQTVAPKVEEPEIYFFREDVPHIFLIAINTDHVNMNRLRFNIINYNLDYFSNFNFVINEKILDSKTQFLTIGPLTDLAQAQNYFELINLSNEIFEGIDKKYIDNFIISDENYKTLIKDANIDKYHEFYLNYYSR